MLANLILNLFLFAGFSSADPSKGCKQRAGVEDVFQKPPRGLEYQGRKLLMIFPPKYKVFRPSPLILAYHDKAMDAEEFNKLVKFDHPDLKNNAIIAFVGAKKGHWITDPDSHWIPKEDSFDSDGEDAENDLYYTRALLDHLVASYCINVNRVYAVGLGTGGGMVHQLACHTHLSRRIAAFAPVNGAFYRPRGEEDNFWGRCKIGRRPIPMLEIHGAENDEYPLQPVIEKAKSLEIVAAEEWLTDWRSLNACGANIGRATPSKASDAVLITQLEQGQMSESVTYGGIAFKTAFRCGSWYNRNDTDFTTEEKDLRKIFVLHYAVKGFQHGWPRQKGPVRQEVFWKEGTVKPLGAPNFDASSVVLDFFRHHKLPDQRTIQGQAKQLLIERGAPGYQHGPGMTLKDYQRQRDEL